MSQPSSHLPCLTSWPIYTIAIILIGSVLILAKSLLIPLAIALFIWYLINAIASGLSRYIPSEPLCLVLSVISFIGIFGIPVEVASNYIPELVAIAPTYQANLQVILDQLLATFMLEKATLIHTVTAHIDISKMATGFANSITQIAGNTIIIAVYVAFLLFEQNSFERKLSSMFKNKEKEKRTRDMLNHIFERIKTYLWIKTLMSLLTAAISYVIMLSIGLDFAAFWAILIFFLNFIPNIGSIIATLFPMLIAVVQFNDMVYLLLIGGGIGATQFIVGNVLEPKILGNSLNLSPTLILVSLVVWGSMWGITGMYLSVPIMVIAMIIFAEFERTRPLAIFLSNDGQLEESDS